jgi:arylsulfatase A-like enzyme
MAGVVAALALLLTGCSPGDSSQPPPDVLFVTVDTLRHDYVSAYGHLDGTTPTLDRMAREGALFENSRSVTSITGPVHTSLFSGLYPRAHGVNRNGDQVPDSIPWLPERLAEEGYRTVGVVGSKILGAEQGYQRGFEDFDDEMPVGAERDYERPADQVVEAVRRVCAQADPRPLFLWVHLYDPHGPHEAPAPFVESATSSSQDLPTPLETSPRIPREKALGMRRGYEAEVRYVDDALARILESWNGREGAARGLIVLTADHGEGLGEHDTGGHGLRIVVTGCGSTRSSCASRWSCTCRRAFLPDCASTRPLSRSICP